MEEEILSISANLRAIIKREIPNKKSEVKGFVSSLDTRFPNLSRTLRQLIEEEYKIKFGEKYVW